MKNALLWMVVCLLLSNCIDRFEGDFTSSGSDRIAITGGITNIEMPTIRVYQSLPFDRVGSSSLLINDALVWIEDGEGRTYDFELGADQQEKEFHFFKYPNPASDATQEVFWDIDTLKETIESNRRYEPIDKSFRGIIGQTYTLHVQLEDGSTYVSTPQLLSASPEINNAYGEYERGRVINELGNEAPNHIWNLFVETSVPTNEEVYLTWRYKGVYEIETFPEDFCAQPQNDCDPGIAHPREVPPGCCKYCYVSEYGSELPGVAARESTSARIAKQIATIPITGDKVYNYYQANIYQLSVSQEVFQYLESVNQQITGQGTIFDPTPTTNRGNIFSADDPEEKVLGMFYAAGVSTSTVNLNRSGISTVFSPNYFPNDCRLANNSTSEKPESYISGKQNWCYNAYIGEWNNCDFCFDMAAFRWRRCPD